MVSTLNRLMTSCRQIQLRIRKAIRANTHVATPQKSSMIIPANVRCFDANSSQAMTKPGRMIPYNSNVRDRRDK